MGKQFFETFPTLQLSTSLKDRMATAQVMRINYAKDRRTLLVYVTFPHLIPKEDIYEVEKQIEQQLFEGQEPKIRMMERFQLSEQYTLEHVFRMYQDSILLEFHHHSDLEYQLLRKAQWEFPDETHLELKLPETMWSHLREADLIHRLQKIFCERCGLEVEISVTYFPQDQNRCRQEAEFRERELVRKMFQKTEAENEPMPWDDAEGFSPAQDLPPKEAPSPKRRKDTSAQKASHPENTSARRGKTKREPSPDADRPSYLRSNNPEVLYGRDFDDAPIRLEELQEEMGEVTIYGKISSMEMRELRNGTKTLVVLAVTDFSDSIAVKLFLNNADVPKWKETVAPEMFVKIKGVSMVDRFDKELAITTVYGMKKSRDMRVKRTDLAPVKRVELHCHTKASEMDGVAEAKDLVKHAREWGHPALAITDHGCAYSFPDAFHAADRKDPSFKVIYGVEGYLVDDQKETVMNAKGQDVQTDFVVFDLETTGFSPVKNRIIEIGAVKIQNGVITDRFSTFVNPKEPIPFSIEKLTGIQDAMVMGAPDILTVLPQFLAFCGDSVLVAHNAAFDVSFITAQAKNQGIDYKPTYIDTVGMARALLPQISRYKLDNVAKHLGISLEHHHRAVDDAECAAIIFLALLERLKQNGVSTLEQMAQATAANEQVIKKLPTYHIVLLAATEQGRINLYRIISDSHIRYFARRPRIPRSELQKYREGLIIGSACEAGELYQALLREEPEEVIAGIVNFYDYLEIQPIGNNRFMIGDDSISAIQSEQDLEEMNRRICRLGEQFDKPVCATCDVHFLNPEDEVYRRIIMAGKGFEDADQQAPLYFRTTEEMLEEFQYLGSEKAMEVVVTNTNRIADRIDRIEPVRPDKCPPVIPNSDVDLRNMCYQKAISLYGDPLPPIVEERLERELHSIISNGFAVMYIIAQKLVSKSNEDGYMVGSRGSVGSSFVATMSGITEVNPLSPHYYCESCHYSDFDSEAVTAFRGGAGCDMPDRLCPVCGSPLKKDGFDIPFETFLGFKGNKEPDIDLNFSGEYQSKAHAYTEVIFGEGQTFRAGTIGTVADKTAYGFVKNYFEERNIHKRNVEIARLAQGCSGVRRSSGQHPGGIIVLPIGESIYSFTPVQRPANDMTTDTVTTHFDYHSIDHNLLKLDILGHDDPTMIRMLEDLTGLDAKSIPLDDPKVMSLFQNTSALGIQPEDILGCKLGALGIPEFGTDFAMQMLIDTNPQHFSDLVRIAGLSHGTDVWLGNAQTLLQEGKATISTCICTRDDIMTYLIQKGMDKELSFTIMESVRKGKGLKESWEEEMLAHDVPDWYIWSCKKIKYMFPKAHAAAYVMMAWRIAYCKVYYPLAYYAAYFSIRATGFTYGLMCMGKKRFQDAMQDYQNRMESLTNKEQDTYKDMRIVQEMFARGFEFMPIDVYRAKGQRFQIIDGKLMPSFASIDGLGDKAAQAIEEAAQNGAFLSLDDFRERTKVSKTMIDTLVELQILNDLPESNQLAFHFTD